VSVFSELMDKTARPVRIADIDVPQARRRIDPDWVETLATLFADHGQEMPISVVRENGRYRLIYGAHRLEAARRLGWVEILAHISLPEDFRDAAEIKLREISENLARRELSVLDRAFDIAQWRTVYEAAAGPVKAGRPRKLSQVATISAEQAERFAESFGNAARRVLGLSRDGVSRAMRIASISDAIRQQISLHPIADNQSELLTLADQPPARRVDIAALLTAEPAQASTVAGAIAILDRHPPAPPKARWQKVSAAFAGLKAADQEAFFSLHEDAIRAWLAGRS
jgi:ParB family chromosome partitioning protein